MTLFRQVQDFASRANPYPLYAELRTRPVWRQSDGTYVISTYREIAALLGDPRLSSDPRSASPEPDPNPPGVASPAFILLDPPEHDRLRAMVARHFGPTVVNSLQQRIRDIVNRLLDAQQNSLDVVSDFAFPLPVTIICEVLGVPPGDEERFRTWSDALAGTLDPLYQSEAENKLRSAVAHLDLAFYMSQLLSERRASPRPDMLSALLAEPGLSDHDLIQTAVLLMVAGHETTVNLICNGVLALLRNPQVLQRLQADPDLIVPTVEEILRFDPPFQFRTRTALADIDVGDTTIPAGAQVVLLLASGQRDETVFADADRFDPFRESRPHLAFGLGVHFCIGAPLARLEGRIALSELFRRLVRPRLVTDPPPYRLNPVLRGPQTLRIEFDGVLP